jgi:uncharacterized protein
MVQLAHMEALADVLRASANLAAKRDIAFATDALAAAAAAGVPNGDDCAAIPDGDGYLLFAIEGFINEFVARDPWFAGWCGIMVNLSDVTAMGGRPIAVVDALWAKGEENARPILDGLRAAAAHFGLPIVGGHTNLRTNQAQLSVAILGRARKLLSSFAAEPGERLVAAIDLRGRYRPPFLNFEAAIDAPATRLRGDLSLMPEIAEAGLARAAKDISQAGLVGTAAMLAECSQVGVTIDLTAIPKPADVPLDKWLLTFPSYGYLLSVRPDDVGDVIARFTARDLAAADIGEITSDHRVVIAAGTHRAVVWDFTARPLIGAGARGHAYA